MPFVSVPTALAIAGIATAGAGTAISTVGNIKAGNAAQKTSEFNAQTAEVGAQRSIETAAINEAEQRHSDSIILGQGRAIGGASGIDVNSGSPLLVQAENARQAELNALIIRRQGALEAESQRLTGQNQILQGQQAKTASLYNAAGTLLTGGGNILRSANPFIPTPKPKPTTVLGTP